MNKDCELQKECIEFLCEFPDRIPYRCHDCTPMVKFILNKLKEKTLPNREYDVWNNGWVNG